MYPASSEGLNKETKDAVYFFTTAFHPLDNFSAHAVRIWGKRFLTSEHAYQWKKISGSHPEIAEEIFNADSSDIVKNISMLHNNKVVPSWHEKKVQIMEEILRKKAEQHEDVREVLAKSGTRKIIENSPVDAFWGVGADGKGKNTIGKLWMKIRDELV